MECGFDYAVVLTIRLWSCSSEAGSLVILDEVTGPCHVLAQDISLYGETEYKRMMTMHCVLFVMISSSCFNISRLLTHCLS